MLSKDQFPTLNRPQRRRAIIYCRVSTDKQEQDGESLEYQEEKCRHYAELHDIDVIIVLHEAKSGYIHYSLREKLTLARQMIRDGLADMIIVWDLRRFSRNFVHSAMIFEEIESNGGQIVSVSENIDNSLTGKLIRSILAWSAESEREKIVEYANRHWQKRHELGLPMATTTPSYGWKWGDKEKTYFVLNKEEAAVRRSIFEMFVEMDMSIRKIGHKLTSDGIPAPREARRLQEEGKVTEEDIDEERKVTEEDIDEGGKPKLAPWNHGTIHQYLQDVANIGTLVICKKKRVLKPTGGTTYIPHPEQKTIPNAIPRIVSDEMYERAQRKLSTNQQTKSHLPYSDIENYLLIGHVYCSVCGNRMHPISEKGLPVYRCNKHISILDPHPKCEPHVLRIKTSFVDPVVWENCCQVFERLSTIQDVLERSITQSLQNMLEDTKGKELIIEKEEEIILAKLERDKHPKGGYTYNLISQDIQRKEEELRRFKEEFTESRSMVQLSSVYQQSVMGFLDFLNTMRGKYHKATFAQKRNALDVLGVKVYVKPGAYDPPKWPVIETEKEWLSVSEVSELTSLHPSSIRTSIQTGKLKSEKKAIPQTIIHRDEIRRFVTTERQISRLAKYDDEWFAVYKLTATVGISNYHDIHEAIKQGKLKAETRDVMQTFIHRDELNRFLQESPIRERYEKRDVSPQVEIMYSPIFTGVHASKDAQQVVNVVHNAGLASLVARLKPIIVVKG
jgi:site-specific DNA recombinase